MGGCWTGRGTVRTGDWLPPMLCLKTTPPLPPDQKLFLTGVPSNSPAQLRSDEEEGTLNSLSLSPD